MEAATKITCLDENGKNFLGEGPACLQEYVPEHVYGNIGCVIMASGMGKRFGGNKLMADFHGRPLICRVLEATEGIFAKRVVVTRHPEIATLCEHDGVSVILHDMPYRSDTVRLGLEMMKEMDRCMFCPGDQPLLAKDTVSALARASAERDEYIWRAACGEVQGTPVVFPSWAFVELLDLPEGKGGNVVIKKYPEHVRTIQVRDRYELKDVDSPEDLQELRER